jgi:hypothetical protein
MSELAFVRHLTSARRRSSGRGQVGVSAVSDWSVSRISATRSWARCLDAALDFADRAQCRAQPRAQKIAKRVPGITLRIRACCSCTSRVR